MSHYICVSRQRNNHDNLWESEVFTTKKEAKNSIINSPEGNDIFVLYEILPSYRMPLEKKTFRLPYGWSKWEKI